MENESGVASIKDDRKFEVECEGGDAGGLRVGTESLSVKVGQRVRRDVTNVVGAPTGLILFLDPATELVSARARWEDN